MEWSLTAFAGTDSIDSIVVALPEEALAQGQRLVAGIVSNKEVTCVAGGSSRSHSVKRALEASGVADYVVVHDAARPYVTANLIDSCLSQLAESGCDCVIAAVPVRDTVKVVDSGKVSKTLDRSRLWQAQTPQAFKAESLRNVLEKATDEELALATDDAALVEADGGVVEVYQSTRENIKITTAEDLRSASRLSG